MTYNTIMTIAEAKQIRIVDWLSLRGYSAVKVRGAAHWYCSPFRNESTPSFKVDDYKNEWYDFGTAQGGDIIDLCQLMYRLNSISEALGKIADKCDVSSMRVNPNTQLYKSIRQTMTDIEVMPLQHYALLSYLRSRGVDVEVGQMYCHEVHYSYFKRRYFAIAFKNNSDGYEVRNAYFKGCIYHKDISVLPHSQGVQQRGCCVFEGFMDFLSYQTMAKQGTDYRMALEEPCDCIVLNSVSNLKKCYPLLDTYQTIHCFLDNDTAGQCATTSIKSLYEMKTIDESFRYADYNDVNDYLLNKKR